MSRIDRTNDSTCAAVELNATLSSSCSRSGVATLVSARTFEYDRRPWAKACRMSGTSVRAWATRSCSCAVRSDNPARHDNQCAHDRMPSPLQAWRSSNSAKISKNCAVSAAICPAKPTTRSRSCASVNSPTTHRSNIVDDESGDESGVAEEVTAEEVTAEDTAAVTTAPQQVEYNYPNTIDDHRHKRSAEREGVRAPTRSAERHRCYVSDTFSPPENIESWTSTTAGTASAGMS